MKGPLSENINNIFIGAKNHCLAIMPINQKEFVDYYETIVKYDKTNDKENMCYCDEIITPEELQWLMMYWYEHDRYLATIDEPMCDRIANLIETLEGIKRYDAPAVLINWCKRRERKDKHEYS